MEKRLTKLENAHRALAAQHTALMAVCRVMLPLIDADPATVRRLLRATAETYDQQMNTAGHDPIYQEQFRKGLALLTGAIHAAAEVRQPALRHEKKGVHDRDTI